MQIIFKIIKKWLPLAIASAGLCALVYVSVQQSLRMSANDPQIQMAEDAASALNRDAKVEAVIPATQVELSESLAPFLMVFDQSGKVVASSAILHGAVPSYPSGVLDYVRQNGQERVTWQPEAGVRMATVAVPTKNGFVMAGRSLLEIEKRESQAEELAGLALLGIWAATLVVIALGELASRQKSA